MGQGYVDLVSSLRESGDLDGAVAHGLRGLTLFPRADLDCAVALAYLVRNAPGDKDQALRHYQRARSLHAIGDAKLGDQDAYTWKPLWGMAHVYVERGQWDRALTAYQEALRYVPQNVAVHRQTATVLRKLGRPAEAVEHVREALDLLAAGDPGDPDNPEVPALNVTLVDTLIEAEQLQEAYDYLDGLARAHPGVEAYVIRLADLLIDAKEYDAALSALAGAVSGETAASSAVYQRLGEALHHLGRLDDARNAYQMALSANPRNQVAEMGLRAL
jgi:tetratricopeptide (TPR) repeat protein